MLGPKAKRAKRQSLLERRIPKKTPSSRKLKTTLILSLLSSLTVGGYFAYPPVWTFLCQQRMFTIEEVTFSGNPHIEDGYLLSLLPPTVGQNLLAIKADYLRGTMLLHPWVKEAQIHRRLPNRLTISIVEKKPIALINADRLLAVDQSGILLPIENRTGSLDVPLINCPPGVTLRTGQKIADKRILYLLPHLEALHKRLPQLWSLISEISWDDQNQLVMISTLSQAPILLGTEPNWEQMLNLYAFLLYQGSRTGLDNLSQVDLRFSGQIVVRRVPVTEDQLAAAQTTDKGAS